MKNDHLSLAIAEAQREMRYVYLGGAPGMLASALVWLAAALLALYGTPGQAVLVLLFGGILIFPLGVLLTKLLGRKGMHSKGNPLGQLALEGTAWMIFNCALAYGVSLWRTDLFFPAMLLVIGGRYLTFATIYGMRIFWACGAMLATAGFLLAANFAGMAHAAFAGAAIETAFAVAIYAMVRKQQ